MEAFHQPNALTHIKTPILVATAGEELLIDNASHVFVVEQLPNAVHITLPTAKHEILMEKDEVRAKFWQAFDALAEQVKSVSTA